MDLFRDSTLGQLLRLVCRQEWLLYPEERQGFVGSYDAERPAKLSDEEKDGFRAIPWNTFADSDHLDPTDDVAGQTCENLRRGGGGLSSDSTSPEEDLEAATADEKLREPATSQEPRDPHSQQHALEQQGKEIVLVDWYGESDPENPQNWSTGKKVFVTSVLWLYTFMVYCASAIYTPSIDGVREEYQVGHITASLGLSLYVLGYGLGPMVFSPLSEIPRVGRNLPYIATLFLYAVLAVPTVLLKSFAGFLVLRLVTGILGSPCLATGGATLQDMYSSRKLPYGYTAWVGATFCAPALGPVMSGFAVASDWRWSMWEVLWMAVFTFVIMLAAFPETSASTILLRRAQRLRKRFGDDRYKSASESSNLQKGYRRTVVDALIRPLQITVMDPAVLFTNLYSAYSYGVYYSFFEAFPLVYSDVYGFGTGLTGTAFLSIVIACMAGSLIFVCYVYYYLVSLLSLLRPVSIGAESRDGVWELTDVEHRSQR